MLFVWLVLALLVIACRKTEDVSVANQSSSRALPSGWSAAPAISMRKASFVVKGGGGTVADISLLVRTGRAGGVLKHINGWRIQLGLPALTPLKFEETARWISVPVGEAVVIDIASPTPENDNVYDGRLVAVIVEKPEETWFFKMRGNPALVRAQKSAFLNWVNTVKPKQTDNVSLMPLDQVPASSETLNSENPPRWKSPPSWERQPSPPERYATFLVESPDGLHGKVVVSLLRGDSRNSHVIVNLQRTQLGLAPMSQHDVASVVQSIWSEHTSMSMIHLASPRGSLVAAWLTGRDEDVWIFQLVGPAGLVRSQRPHFAKFLQSVTFVSE